MSDVPHDDLLDDVDEQLLTELADLYGSLDPVPATLAEDSRIAITVDALDAELATLTETPLQAVRSGEAGPEDGWTFELDNVTLLLRPTPGDGDAVTVDGWVTVANVPVEAHVGDTTLHTTADEHGRFVFDGMPRGRAWFVVLRVEGRPLATPPITL